MGKKILIVVLFLVVIGLGLQFVRPRLDNPPVTGDLQASPAVHQILRRACYNCHSNETKLAWFDQVVPAYWLVAAHVRDGRRVLNFSHWDSLPPAAQAGKLFECLNQMTFQTMPLGSYTAVHREVAISGSDLEALRTYLLSLSINVVDTGRLTAGDRQFDQWLMRAAVAPAPAPNGIAFPAGFENWEVIGTSDRWDNGTMRVILGNPVAVKALEEGKTNPWPDSAIFAKIAWDQAGDPTGHIRTGAFKQVEFMIKDSRRYASTDGWGWARWVKGLALAPYGKNALFTAECMNCHQPMKDRDFFFSLPPARVAPAGYQVIASFIDRSDSTMSTLYGNPEAAASARGAYTQGSALLLATWSQKEDPHWFGANIPGALKSVEKVSFGPAGPTYDGPDPKRLDYIQHIRASVLP
jgi:hypothetical protein